MKRPLIFLFIASALFAACEKPVPDNVWEKGLSELQLNREAHLTILLKKAEKMKLDGGNRPADKLLYDSLTQINRQFEELYTILKKPELTDSKKIQDSLNVKINLFKPSINEALNTKASSAIDSFQFLTYENKTIQLRKENIPEEYSALYKQSLLLELMELESVLLTNKAEKLFVRDFNNMSKTIFMVKADKDRIEEGENYTAHVFFTNIIPVKGKFIIEGKEYTSNEKGIVEYKTFPSSEFGKKKYIDKTVKIAYRTPYIGKDTIMTSEFHYTHKQKCSK